MVLPVTLRDSPEFENLSPSRPALLEAKYRVAAAGLGKRLNFDSINGLQLALGLPGLRRLGAEAFYECFMVRNLRLALLDFFLAPFAFFALGLGEGLVVTRVCLDGRVVDINNDCCDIVEKTVTPNKNIRARPTTKFPESPLLGYL